MRFLSKFDHKDFFLLTISFIILFFALGTRSFYGSEARWAEIAREMLQTKDFFHPTIAGLPYFDKPLLTYWLVAIGSAINGAVNEWTTRIPSAMAGLITIFSVMVIGRKLWSPSVGRLAGWILLSTYGFLFWARTGTAEVENLCAITAAIAWYFVRKEKINFITFFVFYLILFLGALTKGLPAVVIPLLMIFPDILKNRKFLILFKPAHLLAFSLGLVIYLSPFIYAAMTASSSGYTQNGLALVLKENIIRFIKPFDHKGAFYIYFYYLPILLLPWAPLFIASVAGMLAKWKSLDKNSKWLIKAMVLVFVFFTVSGSRRSYYILPLVPFSTLLIAIFLKENKFTKRIYNWGMSLQVGLIGLLLALEIALPFIFFFLKEKLNFVFSREFLFFSSVIGSAGVVLGIFIYQLKNKKIMPALVLSTLILLGGYFCYQQNFIDPYDTRRDFGRTIHEEVPFVKPERIGLVIEREANIVFYLDTKSPIRILKDQKEIREFLQDSRPGVLISQRKFLAKDLAKFSNGLNLYQKIEEQIDPGESESSKDKKMIAWILE